MGLAAPGHIMVEPAGQSLVNWIPGDVITKSHRQGGLKQQKSVLKKKKNIYIYIYIIYLINLVALGLSHSMQGHARPLVARGS